MSNEEYEEKRGPNLGARTIKRHGAQAVVAGFGVQQTLQAMVNMKWLDQEMAFFLLGVLPAGVTILWKWWDGLRMKDRLNAALDKRMPTSLFLLVFLTSGCAIQFGTMEPKHFTNLDGEMLLACETKGVLITMGDSDICSNAMRGGRVSKTFSDMTLGVMRTAGAIVAGFFGGAGQGVMNAVRTDAQEVPVDEAEAQRSVALEAIQREKLGPLLDAPIDNPFTAPEN